MPLNKGVQIFFCGIFIGCSLTFLIRDYQDVLNEKISQSFQLLTKPKSKEVIDQNCSASNMTDPLYKKVRILCWIMTSPPNLMKKAINVRETWVKRCNVWLFMSSVENKDFPAVGLNVSEGRQNLYRKTMAAYRYVLQHHINDADWFMKADDDTYVIVENLRLLLKDHNPDEPTHFGKRFKLYIKQGYMSGGAGYVLSREAVKRFVKGLDDKTCKTETSWEDVEIGRCLEKVGVKAMDSRDPEKRETFFPIKPEWNLVPGLYGNAEGYRKYNFYPMCLGRAECLSNHPISFHQFDGKLMYSYDYMLYHARVNGISRSYCNMSER